MTMKAGCLRRPQPLPQAAAEDAKKAGVCPAPNRWRKIRRSWIKTTVRIYGRKVKARYQSIDALCIQRRAATSAHRRSARSLRPPPRRLFLLHRPHAAAAADPRNLRPALAAGSVLPRRETVPGFEDPQNRVSAPLSELLPGLYIYDPVLLWHAQSGNLFAAKSAIERPGTTARLRFLSKIFSKSAASNMARKDFQRPQTGCTHARNPSTPCCVGQSCCINVQNARLGSAVVSGVRW